MKAPIDLGRFEGIGALSKISSSDGAFAQFTKVFSTGLAVLTVSGGIWFIIQIGAVEHFTGLLPQVKKMPYQRLKNTLPTLFLAYLLLSLPMP